MNNANPLVRRPELDGALTTTDWQAALAKQSVDSLFAELQKVVERNNVILPKRMTIHTRIAISPDGEPMAWSNARISITLFGHS